MKINSSTALIHNKPINCVLFNSDFDLLFTASKDKEGRNLFLWNPATGELVGSYDGHAGVVSSISVNLRSTLLLSAGGDMTVRVWEVATGRELLQLRHSDIVSHVRWSLGERFFLCVQKQMVGSENAVFVYRVSEGLRLRGDPADQPHTPFLTLTPPADGSTAKNAISLAEWADADSAIITAGADGVLRKWDVASGAVSGSAKAADAEVTSLGFARGRALLIATSLDGSAAVFFADTLARAKTFRADRPLYAAALHPRRPVLLAAGGTAARDVTTTSSEEGKIEVLFFDFAMGTVVAEAKGHIGPVYNLCFDGQGKTLVSGGEDSYLRFHYIGDEIESWFDKLETRLPTSPSVD